MVPWFYNHFYFLVILARLCFGLIEQYAVASERIILFFIYCFFFVQQFWTSNNIMCFIIMVATVFVTFCFPMTHHIEKKQTSCIQRLFSQKMKLAFYQFLLIWFIRTNTQVYISGIYLTLNVAMITKMTTKNSLKIGKLLFWTKMTLLRTFVLKK